MKTIFYDDDLSVALAGVPSSLFLAGPTARGVHRTPWREQALGWLAARAYEGAVLLPEFRDGLFLERAPVVFGGGESPVAGMRTISHNVLRWETTGIERSTVALFWMPFWIGLEDDPASLPGFTTRAEVSREIQRDPARLALGMPPAAFSSGHIRYHAAAAGLVVHETLAATLSAARSLLDAS